MLFVSFIVHAAYAASTCAIPCQTNYSSSTSCGMFVAVLCTFSSLGDSTSTSNGGAIYISSTSSSYLINQSFFSKCRAASYGGGIYVICDSGYQTRNCYNNCSAMNGQGCFTQPSSLYSVSYMSAIYCAILSYSPVYNTLISTGGNSSNTYINSSCNYVSSWASAIRIISSYANLSHSFFFNCSSQFSVVRVNVVGKASISNCYCQSNCQTDTIEGVFDFDGTIGSTAIITSCAFGDNTATCFVSSNTSTVTLTNCYFSSSLNVFSGSVTTVSCSVTAVNTRTDGACSLMTTGVFCYFDLCSPSVLFSKSNAAYGQKSVVSRAIFLMVVFEW